MEKKESMIKLRRWTRVVEAANASNLSRSEWCKKMGITENAFYYWQRRVRNYIMNQVPGKEESVANTSFSDAVSENSENTPDFFEIVIPESSAVSSLISKSDDIVSVSPDNSSSASGNGCITIRCGSFSIDVTEGFSKSTFQSVLEVMAHV